jgi:Kef-type K+ transport system membrane component KefB
MEAYPSELLLIAFVAMLAPLLAELPSGFRLPIVVLEVILGILIGPHVFNLASQSGWHDRYTGRTRFDFSAIHGRA